MTVKAQIDGCVPPIPTPQEAKAIYLALELACMPDRLQCFPVSQREVLFGLRDTFRRYGEDADR